MIKNKKIKNRQLNIIGIIPARMASTRFPGKPLARICGMPMVGHVYFRSRLSKTLNDVYITSCDEEILAYAKSIGAKCIKTKVTHQRASERVAEAMIKIEIETNKKADIVVMLQGDEPMLVPKMIDLAVGPLLSGRDIQVVNLMSVLKSIEEQLDPNQIKVVVDRENFALYFSREPIPSRKKTAVKIPMLKQVCIISFRRDFLLKFNTLPATALEIIESVDMLRILEHGYKVKMVMSDYNTYSIDTIEDLKRVEALMAKDALLPRYLANVK